MRPVQQEGCSGLWRSEDMVRLDLILQREALHDTVLEIGLLGKAQFIDLNEGVTAFARPYTSEIRRCEDIQRKLRAIEEEFLKEPDIMEACMIGAYKDDFDMCASVEEGRSSFTQSQMDLLDERVENTVSELAALVSSAEGMHNEMNYDQELCLLNRRLQLIVARKWDEAAADRAGAGVSSVASLSRLPTLLGVLSAEQSDAVVRLCYRVSRGNAVIEVNNESEMLVNPKTGERNVMKATFIVISSSPRMVERLRKLVGALGATIYGVDEVMAKGGLSEADDGGDDGESGDVGGSGASPDAGHTRATSRHTSRRRWGSPTSSGGGTNGGLSPGSGGMFGAADAVAAASPAKGHRTRRVGGPFGSGPTSSSSPADIADALENVRSRKRALLSKWYDEHRLFKLFLKVEKSVLTTMNMCPLSGSTCTASLWIPCKHEGALQRAMDDAVASSGSAVRSILSRHPSQKRPPTFFETNKFTSSFQGIVDSYGMARYKEVNPGVFTIMTFPYLFGIMFGDIGHGIILLLISLYFIAKERSWKTRQLPEILAMVFGGRYLILLMSLFATYMGFLYNDFFGFSLNIFKSGYTWAPIAKQRGTIYPLEPNGNSTVKPRHVYAIGFDVAWAETENKLEYYNSVKMKCAVIVGVVQMFAGLFLALNNYVYQRNWHKIALLFVPEFVFLLATFGYMSILIMVKWCTTWDNTNDAPSILEVMTNFFLQPGTVPQPPLFKGQAGLQVFLLIVAFLMVPVLLLGMPIVELRAYKRWRRRQTGLGGGVVVLGEDPSAHSISPFDEDAANQPAGSSVHLRYHPVGGGGGAGGALQPGDMISEDGSLAEEDIFGPPSGHHRHHSAAAADARPDVVDTSMGATGDGAVEFTDEAATEEDETFANFDFSEMMIHYIIHTIEYVLSSVSNTASYLRLWALSLAHAQLSEVFFTFAVVNLLNADTTGFAIGFGVFAWLGVTLGVLVGMEALSAFLHALRLHWVEFNNKFYLGDGRPLEPLDLRAFNHMS